ncbi:hypothetical protein BX611_2459 [Lutibacter oceani]|uniref:Long-subunit fatty acid transport protein n=1 Tax=Lutibacter oceani TaxID=1853311 RepID=A0A3D9RTE0_9FLAO|nr:hypothetical protein [Lutibacter oceani]REE80804.1 hypothetical protein BX611_2459 [Lutibacter oceani]
MKLKLITLFFTLFSFIIFAQSDLDSPYSIFGLGKENSNFFGASSALGNTGIGYKTGTSLNKLNPASLTAINKNSFLYEIGINNTFSIKQDNNSTQNNFDFNFTHIAIGFSATEFWKMSFGLIPKTKVNYEIDLFQPVEGTINSYNTNIIGLGGLNEVFWGHGLKVTKNLSLGLELLAYFGSINQEKRIEYNATSIYLNEHTNYKGFGLKGAFQYSLNKTTIGATFNLPSTLNGTQDVEGIKTYNSGSETSIIEETGNEIENFELPLNIGVGISTTFKNVLLNIDLQKNYWSDSYISNSNFNYRDQSIYGLGIEYKSSKNLFQYWNKVIYRMGINYDTGYLTLSNTKIDSYGFSAGLGLPISNNSFSTLNLSYSYGKEGTLNKNLIIDNFHKLSINVSLNSNWFQKQKIF